MFFKIGLIGLLLSLVGCVYMPGDKAQRIGEFRKNVPKQCVLLGEVQGRSYYSFLSSGIEMAKARAKVMAANIGATHVQWVEVCSSARATVVAKAYRCPCGIRDDITLIVKCKDKNCLGEGQLEACGQGCNACGAD